MKDGRTHLAHKVEHAADMKTGAILAVTVQGADQGDTTTIKETSRILEWTENFKRRFAESAAEEQARLYGCEREYLIPTMNRGQFVRLTYLNAAKLEQQPTIALDILHKGVKTKFRVPQPEFLGVPQFSAALVGSVLGVVVVALVIATVETLWLAAVLSFLYGLLVLLPGSAAIKLWRRSRDFFSG